MASQITLGPGNPKSKRLRPMFSIYFQHVMVPSASSLSGKKLIWWYVVVVVVVGLQRFSERHTSFLFSLSLFTSNFLIRLISLSTKQSRNI